MGQISGWRSPNYVYRPKGTNHIKVLLKNYKLSDDVAFRFGNRGWESWPLSAETYASWIHSHHGDGQTINLFMDYETFGEHQWEDTGIFSFLRTLPEVLMRHPDTTFKTPTETILDYEAMGEFDVPDVLTWLIPIVTSPRGQVMIFKRMRLRPSIDSRMRCWPPEMNPSSSSGESFRLIDRLLYVHEVVERW